MIYTYEEALLKPEISFDTLISNITMPKNLYKYQSFYDESGKQNPYWMDNMKGTFHLSLGSEFEDKNDCKPYFNMDTVWSVFENFLNNQGIEKNKIEDIKKQTYEAVKEELFDDIKDNFQTKIRIGCFTANSDNNIMWEKYAYFNRGYCIEYNSVENLLFNNSTLPVFYSDMPYDSSFSLANHLIIECLREVKGISIEDQLKMDPSSYEKIIKTAYIPLFLKEKNRWEFEEEFRMFLLKNRSTKMGLIKASDFIDEKGNIDLSSEVTAIYLGAKFDENKESREILKKVCNIVEEKKIQLYKKSIIAGEIVNEKII